jgi:exosortase/archaeosortase family protein
MPPSTYSRLTLALQSWVTGCVLGLLHLLGIAARQQGNLIELAGATVGVEEACSGIRSLLACLYTGVFLSAFLARRTGARLLLVALAGPLAIAMNLIRSLTLTLLTNAGVDVRGGWHDVTGYAILGVTAALLTALAFAVEPAGGRATPAAPPLARRTSLPRALSGQLVLAAFLATAGLLTGFFVLRTRPAVHAGRPAPELAAVLPESVPGWTVTTTGDLFRFADTLGTRALLQRNYYRGTGDNLTQITFYLAYWPPGQTSVSNVALHTPDACWPGAGWQPIPAAATRFTGAAGDRRLPPAEYRLFQKGEITQHVWFWHLYDGTPIAQSDPRSARELLAIAWRYGFHKEGDQLFVRVSSNRPWEAIAGEPFVIDVFARLRPRGI